jgi:hypothetical protein
MLDATHSPRTATDRAASDSSAWPRCPTTRERPPGQAETESTVVPIGCGLKI